MPDITPEELREPILRPDVDVFCRLRKKLDAAADTIEHQAARIAELEAENERLGVNRNLIKHGLQKITALEQQVAELRNHSP